VSAAIVPALKANSVMTPKLIFPVELMSSTPVDCDPSPGSLRSVRARADNAVSNLADHPRLAALTIESVCEWITTDGDFPRFDGRHWHAPFYRHMYSS
jgi:hypothetical protein